MGSKATDYFHQIVEPGPTNRPVLLTFMSPFNCVGILFQYITSAIQFLASALGLIPRQRGDNLDPVGTSSSRPLGNDHSEHSESEPLLYQNLTNDNPAGNHPRLQPSPPVDDSDSETSDDDMPSLSGRLRDARLPCMEHEYQYYIPVSILRQLITVSIVEQEVKRKSTSTSISTTSKCAELTCNSARRLFAALVYVKKASYIERFLDEGITDKDFPFEVSAKNITNSRTHKHQKLIQIVKEWRSGVVEDFDRVQWWMFSPIFELNKHYDLRKSTVLPFVKFNDEMGRKEGAYSEVFPACIHNSHQTFFRGLKEGEKPLVAIKRLFSEEETEFQKEQSILNILAPRKHPHLIRLLVSYRHRNKYHLMFPYADANLRTFWKNRPNPEFNRKNLIWCIKQMAGIASGLLTVHNFRVTIPLGVDGGLRVHKDAQLSVNRGEERFGRHGDLKPENILWFAKVWDVDAEDEDELGVLKIADFGLGRFHGRDSRSAIDPRFIVTSPTYEPPECKLKSPVSRAYDLWSLGCLYLEFVTWLIMGDSHIEWFSDFRGQTGTGGINDDNFFTITSAPGSLEIKAEVRKAVHEWADKLHSHEKCTEALHDLIDLVMKHMLLIKSKDRIQASALHTRMKDIFKRAQRDDKYLLTPAPRPPKLGELRSNSESAISNGRDSKLKKVTFADDLSPYDTSDVDLPRRTNAPVEDLLRNVRNLAPVPSQAPTWPIMRRGT